MNLIKSIREWLIGLFRSEYSTISGAYALDVAITEKMITAIRGWETMYKGAASWVDNDTVISLRLEQAVVRELTNITLNEMEASVSVAKLDDIFKTATSKLNINLQKALASGAMIIKPLGDAKVQYVPQSEFVPVEYDANGRLIKVIFPEVKRVSDSEYLIRLEYHSLDYEKGLTITNRAFRSSSPEALGKEIPLKNVPEWAKLPAKTNYPQMLRPAFGYYVNPIDNTIDGSHAGVSFLESVKQIIKKADIQFGRLDWEFESGERVIHVDVLALQKKTVPTAAGTVAEYEMPKLNQRLYKGLNIMPGGDEDLYKEYSPPLRQTDFIAGLEEYKRAIEFSVGLSYGDISNPQTVDKTATEIKASKKRKYNTIAAIQNNLKVCLDDLIFALAFYNKFATSGYEFICDFKDSILVDDETERKQDMADVASGIMRPEEYRAKWYGETLETALKNLPQSSGVMGDEISVSASPPQPKDASSQGIAEVQGKSLNGAQTQSLIAIMAQYTAGQITEGQAVNLISTAIGISKEEARKLLNGEME